MQESDNKKKRKPEAGLRGITRLYAVQMLYRSEIEKRPLSELIEKSSYGREVFITENFSISEIDLDFYCNLTTVAEKNLTEIDKVISAHLSKRWVLDRLDLVMKSILRLAVAELIYVKEVPANVVFNEYIEISKSFFDKSEVSFVNGLLNEVSIKHFPNSQQ